MHILRDSRTIENGARSWPDPELCQLLAAHIENLSVYEGYGLGELVNFIVFEDGDTVTDLDTALGFPIMANRLNGVRFGETDFLPSWEVIEEHINWFEVVYVLSDDGFGVVVFISKNADHELQQMLAQFARQ